MSKLQVSENRRFLCREDGSPFFWLGDTAWELFHRLDREAAEHYLRVRAEQGFTVIQAVALAELDGLNTPNPYGDLPLEGNDPARPNDAYFRHVDWVVDAAAARGLHLGLLPTWGDKVNRKWGVGPEVFTPENARAYGAFLGRRYRDKPVVWINGGDRNPEAEHHAPIFRALAAGLAEGDGGNPLMTYHPMGGATSAAFFHDDPWLDFNMLQSGHSRRDIDNYRMITADYARTPVKPCLDGEPCYEDHPVNWKDENGYFEAYDVRKAAYGALFAGAHGHTYGCQPVWQMWEPGREKVSHVRRSWREALSLPGATQMRHAKNLLLSRPFFDRVPDPSLLVSEAGTGTEYVAATRASDGGYAFVYTASGRPVTVRLDRLSGDTINAAWYDPRTGASTPIGAFTGRAEPEFIPPSRGDGSDWVLVLDDASRGFPPPGAS